MGQSILKEPTDTLPTEFARESYPMSMTAALHVRFLVLSASEVQMLLPLQPGPTLQRSPLTAVACRGACRERQLPVSVFPCTGVILFSVTVLRVQLEHTRQLRAEDFEQYLPTSHSCSTDFATALHRS